MGAGSIQRRDDLLRGAVLVHDSLVLDAVGLDVELDALGVEGVREGGSAVGHGDGCGWASLLERMGGVAGQLLGMSRCERVEKAGSGS